ncbi:MAG: mannose-1-phosphate guanylyltransferase/mannose-6-phosphate isomerase [Rhodospirillales bacterium]|nr:MAG: mannose-1-phosphate guanylyltransferase/mannose-6-phosphate isomerase [Rhodospirillales bacterium]
MNHRIHPVILSGGAGTRLWPMSRTVRPKQLLPLVSANSMLQDTVARVTGNGFAPSTIVCNQEHRFTIAEQLRSLGVVPEAIVLEPAARNTAPAITAAALLLEQSHPGGTMLVLPSDHVIEDVHRFHDAVALAAEAAALGALVTFGIKPTRPETGYGYIEAGGALDDLTGCFRIQRFVEKPDPAAAAAYVDQGRYAWNSGMFVFRASDFLAEVDRLEPEMLARCREALAGASRDLDFLRLAKEPFAAAPAISVDYAVMERTANGAMIPVDMGWSDVGSWSALWEISPKDDQGNVASGDVLTLDVADSYLRAEGNLIAAVGVRDIVVVATDDVVLVVPKDRAQDVRALVAELEKAGRTEHFIHTRVFRPWGWYQSIDAGPRFQVKQIMVHPGRRLSLQMHYHRAEHWVVVSGTAKVTRGDEAFYLTEDESTYIPHNVRHSLENPGRVPLHMIEVQSGGYLGEDDIVRFDDDYGRTGD